MMLVTKNETNKMGRLSVYCNQWIAVFFKCNHPPETVYIPNYMKYSIYFEGEYFQACPYKLK